MDEWICILVRLKHKGTRKGVNVSKIHLMGLGGDRRVIHLFVPYTTVAQVKQV